MNIVITGASSGLGGGLALSYAAPGASLGLIGRNADRLAATVAACEARGATVCSASLDVGEPEPLGDWLRGFEAASPVDLVVANAGYSAGTGADGSLEPLALASRQVRTNLLGVMHTLDPLLPAMVARRRGQVAVVASLAAIRAMPYSPGYCASKAGARAYAEALRGLLAPVGIRVSVVVPGFFDSRMTDRYQGDKPLKVSTDRAVQIVRRGLDAGRRRIVFPRLLALGMQAADLMPAILGDAIMRGVRFHIRPQ